MKITYNDTTLYESTITTISNINFKQSPNSCGIKLNSKNALKYPSISLSKNKHYRKVLLATLKNNIFINFVFNPDNTLLHGLIEIKGNPGSYLIAIENGILKLIFKSKKEQINHLTTIGIFNNLTIPELDKLITSLLPLIAQHIKNNNYSTFNDILFNISDIIDYLNQTLNITCAILPNHMLTFSKIYNELNLNNEIEPKRNI